MTKIARALGVVLAVVLTLGALAPSALAGQRIQREPDEPGIAGAFDILDIRYINGKKLLSAEVFIRGLQDSDTRVQVRFNTAAVRKTGAVIIVSAIRAAGEYRGISAVVKQGRRADVLQCKGLRAKWNTDTSRVTVQIPQRCLGEAVGKQRLVTRVGGIDGFADKTDPFTVKYR